jgi:hypothetical protein
MRKRKDQVRKHELNDEWAMAIAMGVHNPHGWDFLFRIIS